MSLHTLVERPLLSDMDYWCVEAGSVNVSEEEWKNMSLQAHGSRNRCHIVVANGTVVHCSQWVFKKKNSLRAAFQLVCERDWAAKLIDAVFFAGCLTSDTVMAKTADVYGRYPVVSICAFALVFGDLAFFFVDDLTSFLICRFTVGFALESVCNTGTILLCEVADRKDRSLMILACFLSWGIGYLAMWPIAALIDSWKLVHIIIMLPTMLLVLGTFCIDESPRFLVAMSAVEDAETVIQRAAKKNQVKLDTNSPRWNKTMDRIAKELKLRPQPPLTSILLDRKNTKFLFALLCINFTWCVSTFMYYTMTVMSVREYKGQISISLGEAEGSALELLAFVLAIMSMNRFGRRKPIAAALINGGLLAYPAFVLHQWFHFPQVSILALGISKVFITTANNILRMQTLELIPTVVRSRVYNMCAFCGRLGAILAIFNDEVAYLSSISGGLLPMFSLLCIIGGIMQLRLPETLHRALPDHFSDIEDIFGPFKTSVQALSPRRASLELQRLRSLERRTGTTLTSIASNDMDQSAQKKSNIDSSLR
ncbi:solute carrier family 22 member 3-like [Ornithodoros turicata]|uniref:solute carrier family 22 member 3-like n=1 Tax=Ornithodoros turicata TaxID=34597 RepID=UPI003139092C